LEEKKGFDILIEAVSKLPGYTLVILGKGSLKDHLEEKANEMGVNLILPGYIENPYPYYNNAKVFVLTSKYEGMPNVVLEAMASRVPVVAVECPGGLRELIKTEDTGLLVEKRDAGLIAEAVKRIINDASFAEKLKSNAEKYVSEFDIQLMVKKYESILK
jgi:N-acetylgalactosamine-N,N'-diacetylbacillosaminyl-diphospho-undecaprenol 4-alpha-N-acetylgalactosaminyltransferase